MEKAIVRLAVNIQPGVRAAESLDALLVRVDQPKGPEQISFG